MERHNQIAGIMHRNICTEYGLEVPASRCETSPRVIENEQVKIRWDFQIQTDRLITHHQFDWVVVDKRQRTAVVVDVAIPSEDNVRKKEHEKLKKYQGLKEELENVECEGSSGASCDGGTGSCDTQAGLVAPADTKNNVWDLCPEERIACFGPFGLRHILDLSSIINHPSIIIIEESHEENL